MADPVPRTRSPSRWQWGWLAIAAVLALLAIARPAALTLLFDRAALETWLAALGIWAAAGYVALLAIATTVGLPGTPLVVAGGAVFGLVWGTALSTFGATLGALGSFGLARSLLHDWAWRHWGRSRALQSLRAAVARSPFWVVLAVRFAPISPFNVANFLFGLVPVSWPVYAAGTLAGIVPGTLAYTGLGVAGAEAFGGGDRGPFFLALAVLCGLSLVPVLARRRAIGDRQVPVEEDRGDRSSP